MCVLGLAPQIATAAAFLARRTDEATPAAYGKEEQRSEGRRCRAGHARLFLRHTTNTGAPRRRARLEIVLARRLLIAGVVLTILGGAAALGSVAGASGPADPIAQAEHSDSPPVPSPSDSDDEIRCVMALLIAVAVIALLGTFVYWVRAGDSPPRGQDDRPDRPERTDTLG